MKIEEKRQDSSREYHSERSIYAVSYVNTQLRDHYDSLEEMCDALDVDVSTVVDVLSGIGYTYEADQNCFRS